MDAALPKAERLCGRAAVEELFARGKGFQAGCLRCRSLRRVDDGPVRILVSVPKRHFKRAVKRNLLKRRIREAYRRQKSLAGSGLDLLFVYTPTEVLSYEAIFADMAAALAAAVGREMQTIDNQKDV